MSKFLDSFLLIKLFYFLHASLALAANKSGSILVHSFPIIFLLTPNNRSFSISEAGMDVITWANSASSFHSPLNPIRNQKLLIEFWSMNFKLSRFSRDIHFWYCILTSLIFSSGLPTFFHIIGNVADAHPLVVNLLVEHSMLGELTIIKSFEQFSKLTYETKK